MSARQLTSLPMERCRNLTPCGGQRTFVGGIKTRFLGCGFGQLEPDGIPLVDNDHDGVVRIEATGGGSAEHDGDGVSVRVEQKPISDARIRGRHRGRYEDRRRAVDRHRQGQRSSPACLHSGVGRG
jgi:hypothetical protein